METQTGFEERSEWGMAPSRSMHPSPSLPTKQALKVFENHTKACQSHLTRGENGMKCTGFKPPSLCKLAFHSENATILPMLCIIKASYIYR